MKVPSEISTKARAIFLNYFGGLAKDLSTLTTAAVTCSLEEITLVRGNQMASSPLFEMDRSIAWVQEDGQNSGDLHLVFDITTATALTGFMMMMGNDMIDEQIRTRDYSEEVREGFQEVSNQIVGSINTLIEKRMKGSHLFLEKTSHAAVGILPVTLNEDEIYLDINAIFKINEFSPEPVHWLFSRGFAEALLKERFPEEETDSDQEETQETQETQDAEKPEKTGIEKQAEPQSDSKKSSAESSVESSNLRSVMTESSLSLNEGAKVIQAINAMRQENYRHIGIEKQGKLIRIISRGDLRQLMGPFFGTKMMTSRDKAIYSMKLAKVNRSQKVISISLDNGTIDQAADLLQKSDISALPVTSKTGVLVGFITFNSLLRYFRNLAS